MNKTIAISRTVHFRSLDDQARECRAAMITEVIPSGVLGLAVFFPSGLVFFRDIGHQSNSHGVARAWHWPGECDER